MVHYRIRLMRYLALLLFPVELIRLLHRLFFAAVGDQIVNNHNCEVIEFHDQDTTSFLARTSEVKPILGDPGAASRDDGIFMGESLQQERESSPAPVVNFCP